jgi:hypothetical protein
MDIETGTTENDYIQFNLTGEFILGVIYGHNYHRVFTSKSEMIKDLQTNPKYHNKYIFAHNAEFDLMVLYGNIFKNLDPQAVYNGSKFISATNGNCKFADSLNIYPFGVAEIGKQIGNEKTDLGKNLRLKKGSKKILTRCLNDCKIVWVALFKIFQKANGKKITLAGLSLKYFRTNSQTANIEYNKKLCDKFLNSYYGGRTEVFKLGKMQAHCYDVNSMYPYAMVNCTFPNPKYLKHERNVKDLQPVYTFEGCGLFEVEHPKTKYGFLPYRHNGKLLFPVGKFTGWFNFNELRFALQHGVKVIRIYEMIYAEAYETPFKNFVNDLIKQKIQAEINGNEFERTISKLLLNSLYGKFAQKPKENKMYIDDIEKRFDLIEKLNVLNELKEIKMFSKYRKDAFLILQSNENISNSIPLFSSYITSYARVYLLQHLIKYEAYKPVYCDTDSIFFEHMPPIIESNELGGWKLEPKIITEIRGLKNYSYEVHGKYFEKIKGVPKKATKIDLNTYTFEQLVKNKQALKRNIKERQLIKVCKFISNIYDKRVILSNNETEPVLIQ